MSFCRDGIAMCGKLVPRGQIRNRVLEAGGSAAHGIAVQYACGNLRKGRHARVICVQRNEYNTKDRSVNIVSCGTIATFKVRSNLSSPTVIMKPFVQSIFEFEFEWNVL